MTPATKILLGLGVGAIFLASRKASASEAGVTSTTKVFGSQPVKPLGQADPRWRDLTVGFSNEKFRAVGCVCTALTIAVNALTGAQFTPPEVNARSKTNGGYTSANGASMFLAPAAKGFGCSCPEKGRISKSRNVPEMTALIDSTLEKGGLALIRIDYDQNDANSNNHTIVCFQHTVTNFICADPADGLIITLDKDLFTQRPSHKYFGVGVAPIFRA